MCMTKLKIPQKWSNPTAIAFLVPTIINLYYFISAIPYISEQGYENTPVFIKDMLFFAIYFLIIVGVAWKSGTASLIIIWVILLVCVFRLIAPILINPANCLWCTEGSARSSNWEHALIIHIFASFALFTYLFITKVIRECFWKNRDKSSFGKKV